MTIEQKVARYLQLVDIVNGIHNAAATWDVKYNLIFACAKEIREIDLDQLDYYDPDTTYEADANAYVHALNAQALEIKACFPSDPASDDPTK